MRLPCCCSIFFVCNQRKYYLCGVYFFKMFKLKIHRSQLIIGESYLNIADYLPADKQIIVITDACILKYYGEFFRNRSVIEIGMGEKNKSLDTVADIYGRLLELSADRSCFILAVGGGVVCDIAGFVASTYMRGVSFGFVSTTLLSQVDASIGGKNGVNFGGYKNMVGVFSQPQFVLCDTSMLQTLTERDFISGFSEIVKAAAISSYELFEYLEQNVEKALARDNEIIRHLVIESVKIKASVVETDEREQGKRRILNFGHTYGHAIEAITGVTHGEAVSMGMIISARLSISECGFPQNHFDRLERLLKRLKLPVTTNVNRQDMLQSILKDKKRENNVIQFVYLKNIGEAIIKEAKLSSL